MDDRDRTQIRQQIAQYVIVGRERYNDKELDQLLRIINKREELNGISEVYNGLPKKSYSSDGRYDVREDNIYTFIYDDMGIRILHHRDVFHDEVFAYDDPDIVFNTGRGILNNIKYILRNKIHL